MPAPAKRSRERVEVGDDEPRVRLARRGEGLLDADVQLLRARPEPAAAAGPERLRLRQLLHPEQAAVERARLLLAPWRSGDLDVVDAEDRHRRRSTIDRVAGAPSSRTRSSAGTRGSPPRRSIARIDVELRLLDIFFATLFGILLLPVGLVIAARHARDERPADALPRRAGRPRRPLLPDAEVPHAAARAPRPGSGRTSARSSSAAPRPSTRDRPLAEGVAARRDPAALERPPRGHVLRRPAADPGALLRRAGDTTCRRTGSGSSCGPG